MPEKAPGHAAVVDAVRRAITLAAAEVQSDRDVDALANLVHAYNEMRDWIQPKSLGAHENSSH
jgi:hypothetical protein